MIELTPRQSEVYEAIKIHIEKVGFPPTMIELAGLIGCSSQNSAAEHLKALKKKGYITTARGVARGISLTEKKSHVVKLGLNQLVKIKLNPVAISHLKKLHDQLKEDCPRLNIDFNTPAVDEDGYSTMPLWAVMMDFGSLCFPGAEFPFELAIDLEAK
ncbi:SOS-response repressor and protease LexA [Salmonella enterica subsp. enterica serovar Waycross]|nr:SOS-response repressor and protease LexA [Salmonella enterica subsp. enterica serovar Waycross]EBZ8201352.1 SOS-response repressor and protease LexA [Salmonella enterica subsp. enterica serovar Waycross]